MRRAQVGAHFLRRDLGRRRSVVVRHCALGRIVARGLRGPRRRASGPTRASRRRRVVAPLPALGRASMLRP
ncbi:hypothetical protein M885DRAFT_531552 [Pelagophyceae sp. CCMP2097]|nr:hypothetical protein M885DRAFT_531552 [Pelagophyceae sp. CCMP2097]